MKLSATLSTYIGRQFVLCFGAVFAGISFVVLLAETIELLRRAAGKEQATFDVVVEMALLKLPHMMLVLVPFAILFGGIVAYSKLARTHELVVARAAGISVWQFLLPALLMALLIGLARIAVLGPFAATTLSRFEDMENLYLESGGNQLSVSNSGIWLRQIDGEAQSLIHADRVDAASHRLLDLTMFQFGKDGRFLGRIDAESARLEPGEWSIRDAWVSSRQARPEHADSLGMETDLTWQEIESGFTLPETMSVWELARFISVMEKAGFPAVRHRLHLQAQLASPLLLCAMVLIAATFSLRPNRRSRTTHMIASGAAIGFSFYVASDLVLALGLSGRIPAELAAWAPASVCTMLGIAMLFHLEDG